MLSNACHFQISHGFIVYTVLPKTTPAPTLIPAPQLQRIKIFESPGNYVLISLSLPGAVFAQGLMKEVQNRSLTYRLFSESKHGSVPLAFYWFLQRIYKW